jgi:oligopeptide/dipeptide ABC transporter ATP-binding protein
LSGGLRQRVGIAIAIACEPKLLIADEPTTALDVTVQVQILEVFRSLRQHFGMSLLMISHDLAMLAEIADRVSVMYGGSVVESGRVDDVYMHPRHPYTKGLLASIPGVITAGGRLRGIPGSPPTSLRLDPGCPFRDRCESRSAKCEAMPAVAGDPRGQTWRCWHPLDARTESRYEIEFRVSP